MVPRMDNSLDSIGNIIKISSRHSPRGYRNTQVQEGELPLGETQNSGDSQCNFPVAPRGKKNLRFLKIGFLASKVAVKI